MREAFHEQLDSIFNDLATMCRKVESAVGRATQALLTGDAALAEEVISGDLEIDQARERIEETTFMVISMQQPVAGDLRMLIAGLRMVSELERMGDLSVHVAKIARLRVPTLAVPDPLRPLLTRMADVTEQMVHDVADVIANRDVNAALRLAKTDEEIDRMRRATFAEMFGSEWAHGVEAAVDIALLGRYYERIADHAVSVANRVVFVVTGEYPAHMSA